MDGRVPGLPANWQSMLGGPDFLDFTQPMMEDFGIPSLELEELAMPCYSASPSSEQSSFLASPHDGTAGGKDLKRGSVSNTQGNSRKRRRTVDETEASPCFVPCRVQEWRPILSDKMEQICTLELRAEISKGAQYSEVDNAWILYRKNHFQVAADLSQNTNEAGRSRVASVVAADGTVVRVRRLQLAVNGYKERNDSSNAAAGEEVELYQSPTNRDKSAQRTPDVVPIREGNRVIMERLHFKTATANNFRKNGAPNPLQCFNQLVVSVWAVGPDESTYLVMAVAAGRLVVRGRSPGHYAMGADETGGEHEEADAIAECASSPSEVSPFTGRLGSSALAGGIGQAQAKHEVKLEPFTPPSMERPLSQPFTVAPFAPTESAVYTCAPVASSTPAPFVSPAMASAVAVQPAIMPPPLVPAASNGNGNGNGNGHVLARGSDGSVVVNTNLGVRTSNADEALVVHGNVRVTGGIYQPSDMRIKENIRSVDTAESLARIGAVRLVDYNLRDDWMQASGRTTNQDRGVIAQELKEIIPAAVTDIGDVHLPSGRVLDGMLTANRDALLMETVGATQELAKRTEMLDTRVDHCETAIILEDVNGTETERELRERLEAMESKHEELLKRLEKHVLASSKMPSKSDGEDGGSDAGSGHSHVHGSGVKVFRCEMNWRSMLVALVAIVLIGVVATVVPIVTRDDDDDRNIREYLDLPFLTGNVDFTTTEDSYFTERTVSAKTFCRSSTPLVASMEIVTSVHGGTIEGIVTSLPPTNAVSYDSVTGVMNFFSTELKMFECYYYQNVSVLDQGDFPLGFLNFTSLDLFSNSSRNWNNVARQANDNEGMGALNATEDLYPANACLKAPKVKEIGDPPFIVNTTCPRRRPIAAGTALKFAVGQTFSYLVTGNGYLDRLKIVSPDSDGRFLLMTLLMEGRLKGSSWERSSAKVSTSVQWCVCPDHSFVCANRVCEKPWHVATKIKYIEDIL
eukprot:Opistho-2@32275